MGLVTAEDAVASLQRWGQKDALGKQLMRATAQLETVDNKTFRLDLKEPFSLVLDALTNRVVMSPSSCQHAWQGRQPTSRSRRSSALAPLTPGSPIFKAVQKKWCTAWCRALKKSPTPPESAVGEGAEPSYVDRSVGAP